MAAKVEFPDWYNGDLATYGAYLDGLRQGWTLAAESLARGTAPDSFLESCMNICKRALEERLEHAQTKAMFAQVAEVYFRGVAPRRYEDRDEQAEA